MKYRPALLLILMAIAGSTLWGCAALEKTQRAEEPLEVRLEKILLERAIEYEQLGQPHKALQAYEAALAVVVAKKQSLESSLRSKAEEHYRKGLEYRKQGKYIEARHEFLVALRLRPDFPEVVDLLMPAPLPPKTTYVVHEVKEGEFLTAIAEKYYNDQGKFLVIARFNDLNDPAKLNAGMRLKIPEIEGVRFQKPKRQVPEAILPEDKTSKIGADVGKTYAEETISPVTERQAASGDWTPAHQFEALEYDELAELETDYDQVTIYEEQAVSLLEEGQYLAALHEFQKVYNTDPSRRRIREYMSWAHYRQGEVHFRQAKYLEARRHFKEALNFDEQCTSCQEYLGKTADAYKEVHYLKGIQHFEEERLTEAIEEWELVSEIDFGYKQVQNYLSRAQKLLEKVQELKEKP